MCPVLSGRTLGQNHAEVTTPPGFSLQNDRTDRAEAIFVAIWAPMPRPGARAPTPGELAIERRASELGLGPGVSGGTLLAPDVESHVVTTTLGVDLPRDTAMVLGRVVLAPGESLGLTGLSAPTVVANEAGTIDRVLETGTVWAVDVESRSWNLGPLTSLVAGEGAIISGSAVGTWLSSGTDHSATPVLMTVDRR